MLKKLTAKGFKSLVDVTVNLPRLAVFFGPNAAGKNNLLDAIQTLSWTSVAPTLPDVLGGPFPIRGRAFESLSFGEGGSVQGKPVIELTEGRFSIRRVRQGRPREESPNRNRSILSDRSLSGNGYSRLDDVRAELGAWEPGNPHPATRLCSSINSLVPA